MNAVYEHHVLGLIALDRPSSHLAEQIAVKAFLPVVALSSDRTLTSTNIPWIFRLPEGTPLQQALGMPGGNRPRWPEPRRNPRSPCFRKVSFWIAVRLHWRTRSISRSCQTAASSLRTLTRVQNEVKSLDCLQSPILRGEERWEDSKTLTQNGQEKVRVIDSHLAGNRPASS